MGALRRVYSREMSTERSAPLAEWLDAERERLFVGREESLAKLVALFEPAGPRVAFVEGPAGIGKTQLLHAFDRAARRRGGYVHWLDGNAVAQIASLPATLDRLVETACTSSALVVDNFERLGHAEQWLRDVVMPRLPQTMRIVLAGRQRLSESWTTDPGWRGALVCLGLDALSHDECAAYLQRRGIVGPDRDSIIRDSGGHPLTLTLMADAQQTTGQVVRLESSTDTLERLVSRFLEGVPSDAHAEALQVSAIALHVTPELLRAVVRHPNAYELHGWLASCSFVERVGSRLTVHAAVRAILLDYLRAHTERFHPLLIELLRFYEAASMDDLWVSESMHVWSVGMGASRGLERRPTIRAASPSDWDEIVAIARLHEPDSTVEWLHSWQGLGEWLVLGDERLDGFLHLLDLRGGPADPIRREPGVRALLRALRWHPALDGLRPCWCVRFWMARDGYQSPKSAHVWQLLEYVTILLANTWPALMTQCVARGQRDWERIVGRGPGAPSLLDGAEFESGGVDYGWVWKDLEQDSPGDFMKQHLRGLLDVLSSERESRAVAAGSATIDRQDVKVAFKMLRRPWKLAESPLAALPAVQAIRSTSPNLSVGEAVAALLLATAERSLGGSCDPVLLQVLTKAYVDPASKHEAAAMELRMSYRTFRRKLEEAIDVVSESLSSRLADQLDATS